jgi:hypothetical protein
MKFLKRERNNALGSDITLILYISLPLYCSAVHGEGFRADVPRDCHLSNYLSWIDERGARIATNLGFMESEGHKFADQKFAD